jgi:transposase
MARRSNTPVELGEQEHEQLLRLRNSARAEQRLVERAGIILEAATGGTARQIASRAGVSAKSVYKWTARYRQRRQDEPHEGVQSWLSDAGRVGAPARFDDLVWVDLLALATSEPSQSARPITHWTHRELAEQFVLNGRVESIHSTTVGRFLAKCELAPHRTRGWMNRKDDPDFEQRASEIKALVVEATAEESLTEAKSQQPLVRDAEPALELASVQAAAAAAPPEPQALVPLPEAAAAPKERVVVSFDEKTGMQAKERIAPDKPMKSGSPAKLEFEYKRHGTLCLFAMMLVHSGIVLGTMGSTRTNEDTAKVFAAFFELLLRSGYKKIDVIADQLNTHWSAELVAVVAGLCHLALPDPAQLGTGEQRRAWLSDPTHAIVFHFSPKHASWLNPIECWFGVLAKKVLRRGSFASTADLEQRVQRFIAYYNDKLAHPYTFKRWTTRSTRPVTADQHEEAA